MFEPCRLLWTFTLRTSEGFVENLGADLIARVGQEAPGARAQTLFRNLCTGSGAASQLAVIAGREYDSDGVPDAPATR